MKDKRQRHSPTLDTAEAHRLNNEEVFAELSRAMVQYKEYLRVAQVAMLTTSDSQPTVPNNSLPVGLVLWERSY